MGLWMTGASSIALGCSSNQNTSAQGTTPDSGLGNGGRSSGGGPSGGASNGGGGSSGASGAPATGGVGGAGAGGSAGDAGVSRIDGSAGKPADPCATALYCEDFESYPTGNAPGGDWKPQTNLGAVSVVGDQKFGGLKSAKFTTEMSTGGKTAFIQLSRATVFPVPGNMYYGRMMFRLESAPEASVHWTFIQSGGVVPGQTYHALYRYGGQQPVTQGGTFVGNQLMANYETPDSYSGNGPSSDCWHHAKGTVVPVGRWACVEWQFDGPNNALRMWLDGSALDDLTVQGQGQGCVHQPATFEWTAPKFDNLEVGWESYQGDSARTLYVDDLVIATTRVGCPAAP